ncbi:flagellar hook assembly protein FlgD [Actinoplanes friuliensis]|uniref:Putative flagellar hook capping protein n=1 Tax=Actinoplanes friuliensis DSM 7358 TaxID=1246995 RepID=U5WAU8_9ACTN|nr:flagellar hook capping FlgD N-terminal domain-containing protein [Actinoplanes friuliensis]AGZ46348.1 putative flagellar hook capping protein [Actinoplanes friuliensis DSM 7358]
MTSPIGGNVSKEFDAKNVSATSMYTNRTTTDSGASKSVADQDTFLKLLVAQLKYQDPSNPADSTQFLAQTAQFTQVEKLGQIAEMMQAQQLIGASALVGRTVTFQDANGTTQTGVVTKTKLNGDSEPTLVVGNTDVQLSKVTEVQQATTGPATTGQTATTPATPAAPPATTPAPAATKPAEPAEPATTSDDSATTKDN